MIFLLALGLEFILRNPDFLNFLSQKSHHGKEFQTLKIPQWNRKALIHWFTSPLKEVALSLFSKTFLILKVRNVLYNPSWNPLMSIKLILKAILFRQHHEILLRFLRILKPPLLVLQSSFLEICWKLTWILRKRDAKVFREVQTELLTLS